MMIFHCLLLLLNNQIEQIILKVYSKSEPKCTWTTNKHKTNTWLHVLTEGSCVLFCVFAVCQAVWSQRKAVLLWPQLWAPTPPIWECWTWATIIQETQEWSYCQRDWRIQTGDWTLSGTNTDEQNGDIYVGSFKEEHLPELKWLLPVVNNWCIFDTALYVKGTFRGSVSIWPTGPGQV